MSKVKNTMYAMVGGLSLLSAQANAAMTLQSQAGNVATGLQGSTKDAKTVADNWLTYIVGFLYFVAVVYGLYGGWTIMTAGGDEKKVGTGKSIIIRAVLGLIVIFLANSIVQFIVTNLFGAAGQ